MNVQDQKAIIIEQFKHVNDVHLINAIKSMLDYALNKDVLTKYARNRTGFWIGMKPKKRWKPYEEI